MSLAKVPPEVFREIFLSEPSFKCIDAALLLASVCRNWRSVALDISMLWSTISVSLDRRPPPNLLPLFLTRSRSKRLHIEIRSYKREYLTQHPAAVLASDILVQDEMQYLSEITELIVPHIARWSHIRISTTFNATILVSPLLWKGSADVLEVLEIGSIEMFNAEHEPIGSSPPLLDSAFCAPVLRRLSLQTGYLFPDPDDFQDQFPSLQVLQVSSIVWESSDAPARFLDLTSSHESLTEMHLDCCSCNEVDDPRTFPALEKLTFEDMENNPIFIYLCQMIAPELKELSLQYADFWSVQHDSDSFLEMSMSEHFPSLRTLRVRWPNISFSSRRYHETLFKFEEPLESARLTQILDDALCDQ